MTISVSIIVVMANRNHPKIGLALGSGGAKGLSHIGVLKVLEAAEIDIDYIAGSSIGALVGAYYAAHPSLKDLEELVFSFNKRKGFMLFDPVLRGGLIRGNKIEKFISEMLEGATFKSLRIPFWAVATDFITAEEVVISKGNLVKAVRASISVPAVFKPIGYEGRILADGGLSDPVPASVVRTMGADVVIAVNVDGKFVDSASKAPSLVQTPMHSVGILQQNLTLQSLQTADVIISPTLPSMGFVGWNYFFDTDKAQQIIKSGEDAAQVILPGLRRIIEEKRKEGRGMRRFFTFFRRLRR